MILFQIVESIWAFTRLGKMFFNLQFTSANCLYLPKHLNALLYSFGKTLISLKHTLTLQRKKIFFQAGICFYGHFDNHIPIDIETRPCGLVVQMLSWTPEGVVRSWSVKALIQYVQDLPQYQQDQSQYVQHQQQHKFKTEIPQTK